MNSGDLPVYPVEVSYSEGENIRGAQTSNFSGFEIGLTKREHFAGMSMQGLLAANIRYGGERDYAMLAKDAVRHADALLKELQKNDCKD